jgi:hypothetical protein
MFRLMKTAFVAAAAIFSHIILCIIAWSVGAVTVAPFKFWWWGAGAAFLALVALQLRRELLIARNSTHPASSHYINVTISQAHPSQQATLAQ